MQAIACKLSEKLGRASDIKLHREGNFLQLKSIYLKDLIMVPIYD